MKVNNLSKLKKAIQMDQLSWNPGSKVAKSNVLPSRTLNSLGQPFSKFSDKLQLYTKKCHYLAAVVKLHCILSMCFQWLPQHTRNILDWT